MAFSIRKEWDSESSCTYQREYSEKIKLSSITIGEKMLQCILAEVQNKYKVSKSWTMKKWS